MHRITDQGFVGTKESAGFELPNGTFGTMTGDTTEEVLRRIKALSDYYCRCSLTSKIHTVLMPNGQTVADVPVGFSGQEIFELAEAAFAIHDRQNDFLFCQRLQSAMVH